MLLPRRRERLVRPLEDPLRADVDPRAGGHLAEHRQPLGLEAAELVPVRPARDEQRVRDQDTRRALVRAEDADRLAALNEQRLVLAELEQRAHYRAQRVVIACRLAGAAVDDELLGTFRVLGIEVVEEHAQRRLRRPRARVQLFPARRADRREIADKRLDEISGDAHNSSPTSASAAAMIERSRIASATASMSGPSGRSSRRRGESSRTAARTARTPAPGSSGARNSTACAPASNSIASARSQLPSTCHAFRPAAFPIDT